MPIVPRGDIDHAGLRVPQSFSKGLLSVDCLNMLHSVPNPPRHHVSEKVILVRKRNFRRFPPDNLSSNTFELATRWWHDQNAI